jgi:hypothetical protein
MSNNKMETGSSPAFPANQNSGHRYGEIHPLLTPSLRPSDADAKKCYGVEFPCFALLSSSAPVREGWSNRAVGAMLISPALQRGVRATNNSPGVP